MRASARIYARESGLQIQTSSRAALQKSNRASKHNHRAGFSLIELVFVIAVVGILAAIAIPKLAATRTDALYAAVNSDIQAVISSMQVAALTQDLSARSIDGAFIMQTSGLSPSRWVAQGAGIRLGKNGAPDSANNCVIIDISAQNLQVQVQPLSGSQLCDKLSKTYPTPLHFNLSGSLL